MANPTNKSYDGIITWATGSSNDIQAKNLITARNIKLTNSSNTQLATASFNGTADATLKLAATVPISISGNADTATTATTAEKAYIPQVQKTDSTSPYAICLVHPSVVYSPNYHALSTAANISSMANSGLCCIPGADVAANIEGTTTLVVGNSLAKSAADNRTGNIRIHGNSTGYTSIKPGYNSTGSIDLTLPSSTGTLALTSDITNSSALRNKVLGTHSDGVSWAEYGGKDNTEFKIKIVVPYSGSQNKQYTITWTEPFTTYCCALYCSSDGSNHVIGNCTSVANHFGGHFYGSSGVGHSWNGSALSLTSYRTPNSYIYMIIIVGV